MSCAKNPATKVYEADIKDRVVKRLHVSLRTKNEREAMRRYAAVETAVRQNHAVVDLLRRKRLNVQALTACYEAGKSFDTLLAQAHWPALGVAVADYVDWLDAHPTRSDKTARNARSTLGAAVEFFGAATRLDTILVAGDKELATQGVREWHTQLTDGGRMAGTVTEYVRRLSALFSWVQQREDATALVAKRAPKVLHTPIDWEFVPRGGQTRARYLTPGEAARLLAATPLELRFVVAAGLLAGLRIEEALFLSRPDIDRTLGQIYVQQKPAAWRPKKFWKPKSKSAREVPLDTQLAGVLDVHAPAYAGPLWLTPSWEIPDRPLTSHTLGYHMRKIVRAAGLVPGRGADGVTFHTLRHTFASWLVMEGVDLLTVSRLLGHTTTKQVESTYAHLSPEHRAQAVARLGNRFTLALPAAPTSADANATPSQDGLNSSADDHE